MDNSSSFDGVLELQPVKLAMERQKLDRTEVYGKGKYRESRLFNGGVKIWKDDWTVHLPARGIEGVNVHFECKRPDEILIHVEVFPYEGCIDKDPARLAELKRHIEIKTELITTIRNKATSQPEWKTLGVTTSHLNRPEIVSTICAVKFQNSPVTPPTRNDAEFIGLVIDRVAPAIDKIILAVGERM